jgi:hypothetical protein
MDFTDITEANRAEVISYRPGLEYLFDLVDESGCSTSFEILATDKERMRYIIAYAIRNNQFKRIGKDSVGMALEEWPNGRSLGFSDNPSKFSRKLHVCGTYWIDTHRGETWRFTRLDGEWWFFNGIGHCTPMDIVRRMTKSNNTAEHQMYSHMAFKGSLRRLNKRRAMAASAINQAAVDSHSKCMSLIKPIGVHYYEMPKEILPLARLFRAVCLMLAGIEQANKKRK